MPPLSAVTVRLQLRAVHAAAVDDGCAFFSALPVPGTPADLQRERTKKQKNKRAARSSRLAVSVQTKRPAVADKPSGLRCARHGCPGLPVDAHCPIKRTPATCCPVALYACAVASARSPRGDGAVDGDSRARTPPSSSSSSSSPSRGPVRPRRPGTAWCRWPGRGASCPRGWSSPAMARRPSSGPTSRGSA